MSYKIDCFMAEVFFIDTEQEFNKVLKKIDVVDYPDKWVTRPGGATTHHFRVGGWRVEIICLPPFKNKTNRTALLAH